MFVSVSEQKKLCSLVRFLSSLRSFFNAFLCISLSRFSASIRFFSSCSFASFSARSLSSASFFIRSSSAFRALAASTLAFFLSSFSCFSAKNDLKCQYDKLFRDFLIKRLYVKSQITIYRYLLGILLFGDQSCTHYQLMYEFASSPLFFFLLFELGYFFLSIAFHLGPSHFPCLLRLDTNIPSKTQMHTRTCRISRFHFGMFPLFPVLEPVFLSTI